MSKLKQLIEAKRNPEIFMFKRLEEIRQESLKIAQEGVKSAIEGEMTVMRDEMAQISQNVTSMIQEMREKPASDILKSIGALKGNQGETPKVGVDFKQPEDGKTPVKGKDYFDGKKGDKGESIKGDQGKEGKMPIAGVDFPLPENGKNGENGDKGDVGDNGENGSPDTGNQIIKKINDLPIRPETQIDASRIKNLPKFKKKDGGGGKGGGMGNIMTFEFTGDGSTTDFTLPGTPTQSGLAVLAHYNGQWIQHTTHFTVSGKILSTTFTPENGTIIEGFIIT